MDFLGVISVFISEIAVSLIGDTVQGALLTVVSTAVQTILWSLLGLLLLQLVDVLIGTKFANYDSLRLIFTVVIAAIIIASLLSASWLLAAQLFLLLMLTVILLVSLGNKDAQTAYRDATVEVVTTVTEVVTDLIKTVADGLGVTGLLVMLAIGYAVINLKGKQDA